MYPEILYKYRDWNNKLHQRIITENEIFLAKPSSLNDPFDSKIPIRFDKGSKEKAFEMALEIVKLEYPRYNDEAQQKIAKEIVDKGLWKDPRNIEAQTAFQRQKIDKDFGICSFSDDKNLNLVWTHYGASHYGFCVGFNTQNLIHELKNRILSSTGLIIDLLNIDYVDEFPYIDGFDESNDKNLIRVLKTKARPWDYEQEHRLILLNGTNKAVKLSDSVIQDVVFGIRMDEKFKKEIIATLKDKQNNSRLYQAKLSENSFEILFDEIQY